MDFDFVEDDRPQREHFDVVGHRTSGEMDLHLVRQFQFRFERIQSFFGGIVGRLGVGCTQACPFNAEVTDRNPEESSDRRG